MDGAGLQRRVAGIAPLGLNQRSFQGLALQHQRAERVDVGCDPPWIDASVCRLSTLMRYRGVR